MSAGTTNCLACSCRLVSCRGLCQRCYGRYGKLVRNGKTTWLQLEREGKARPPAPKKQFKFK
jgi:hypothetical protein